MHSWESIQQAIDYIEENLTKNLSIEELAEVAALSPFYFQRLFHRLVKLPICEYTKMRRLSRACELLRDTNRSVVDIAEELCFSSHSNFTRAFKKVFEITPEQMRHVRTVLNQYVKPDLLLNYVMIDENVPLITDGIVLEVTRKKLDIPKPIIGIAKEIPLTDIMGGQDSGISITGILWEDFHARKASIHSLLPDGKECGVLYMGKAQEGYCMYLAGAEANAETETVPEDFSIFTMPEKEYVVCGFEAESFEELVTSTVYKAQTFMDRWMNKHGLTTTDFAVELYSPIKDTLAYMETWFVPIPISSPGLCD